MVGDGVWSLHVCVASAGLVVALRRLGTLHLFYSYIMENEYVSLRNLLDRNASHT